MVIGEPAACRQPMSLMANTTLALGTVWRCTSRFNLLYRNELSLKASHFTYFTYCFNSRGGPVSRNMLRLSELQVSICDTSCDTSSAFFSLYTQQHRLNIYFAKHHRAHEHSSYDSRPN
jgi:hypothetical protein